jgi:hypothetical protein
MQIIADGWSYIVWLYQLRKEILDGKWKFPSLETVR